MIACSCFEQCFARQQAILVTLCARLGRLLSASPPSLASIIAHVNTCSGAWQNGGLCVCDGGEGVVLLYVDGMYDQPTAEQPPSHHHRHTHTPPPPPRARALCLQPHTCSASSRVGPMTMAPVPLRGMNLALCMSSTAGIKKASVLPDPVRAAPNTSRPVSSAGMVRACSQRHTHTRVHVQKQTAVRTKRRAEHVLQGSSSVCSQQWGRGC